MANGTTRVTVTDDYILSSMRGLGLWVVLNRHTLVDKVFTTKHDAIEALNTRAV